MERLLVLRRTVTVLLLGFWVGWPAAQVPPAAPAPVGGALDGVVFVGHIGPRGAPDTDDELHFSSGQFWSSSCVRCGFAPGAYVARRVGSVVHFRGEIGGEDGHFFYEGTVEQGNLRADIRWIKKRWYRTIDRELEFVGVARAASPVVQAADALAAARRIVSAGRECEP